MLPLISSICAIDKPAASAAPTIAPADVPAMQSMGTFSSSSTRNAPKCAKARAAPPESARPTRGLAILLDPNIFVLPGMINFKRPAFASTRGESFVDALRFLEERRAPQVYRAREIIMYGDDKSSSISYSLAQR
jgi:hypothetical protein